MNEEETAHLRSYLTSQSMRRTPEQLMEVVEIAYTEFVEGIEAVPAYLFRKRVDDAQWSASELLEHVQAFFGVYEQAICIALEGEQEPEAVEDAIPATLPGASKKDLLTALEASRQRLRKVVLQTDPLCCLALTWKHFELGPMHWREWLLFMRIHLLEHVRQAHDLVKEINTSE